MTPTPDPPLSKAERARRQMYPFSRGGHLVRDFAQLHIVESKSYKEVAQLWGLRPNAGPLDLYRDLQRVWHNHGCWGGLPMPEGYGKQHQDEWARWRAQKDDALHRWLAAAARVPLEPHCESCTCYGPARG